VLHWLIVLTLPPRYRCPLNRLPASRLLLPRSGLERSDFVLWPIATEIHVPWNVGDQGKSGLVVLNMSFGALDEKEPFAGKQPQRLAQACSSFITRDCIESPIMHFSFFFGRNGRFVKGRPRDLVHARLTNV
jgi:hypothetical protein